MTDRATAHADTFDEHNRRLIADIESFTPEQMQAYCEGEQCTVAALATHIANVHALVGGWIEGVLAGQPLPEITMDDVNAANAEQFARDTERPKDEILAALREQGAYASKVLHGIDDVQLGQSQYFKLAGGDVSTEWLVRDILIGDIANHSASIRAATGQAPTV